MVTCSAAVAAMSMVLPSHLMLASISLPRPGTLNLAAMVVLIVPGRMTAVIVPWPPAKPASSSTVEAPTIDTSRPAALFCTCTAMSPAALTGKSLPTKSAALMLALADRPSLVTVTLTFLAKAPGALSPRSSWPETLPWLSTLSVVAAPLNLPSSRWALSVPRATLSPSTCTLSSSSDTGPNLLCDSVSFFMPSLVSTPVPVSVSSL